MKLVVTEKPAVARDIAAVLKISGRHNGYIEGKGCVVTWAVGHLVELKEPHEYHAEWKSWSLDMLPMVPEKFALRPRGDTRSKEQLGIVRDLMKKADEIVCATDAGREGELIFRYILEYARCTKKPVRRLWISSLTSASILDGFKNLRPGKDFEPLYHAARCRSEADWIVGLNGTRYYTVGYGVGRQLWTVGRVQTPVLALIVNRDWEIDHFKPKDYWELHTTYRDTTFKHTRGKFEKEDAVKAMLEQVKGHELVITKITEKQERALPPLLYDLTALQKDMNKRFGMTADGTLKAAQSLYERKHLTYPRTDSQYLTSDMQNDIAPLLETLRPRFQAAVDGLDPLSGIAITKRVVDDKKVGDHHAILPTEVLPGNLTGNEKKVWEAVALRFISIFHPPCIKGVTTVDATSNEEPFRARGTVILDPGWQALHPGLMEAEAKRRAKQGQQTMPKFEEGEKGPHEPKVLAKKTTPPKRYTEGTLLQAMETAGKTVDEEALKEALKEKGLGTPATRAGIIETLIRRQYLERQKKNLISTTAGKHLISLVQDERLKSAELTGEWEQRLKKIEKGVEDPKTFMQDVVTYTAEIVQGRGAPATSAGEADQGEAAAASAKPAHASLGKCPNCHKPVIEGQRGYGCSGYKDGCTFVLWKEQFGAAISSEMARGIIASGRTLQPIKLVIDDKETSGHIHIKGVEVSWEPAALPPPSTPGSSGPPLGECPLCKGAVVETKKAYGCANWRDEGCKFVIWKQIAKKKISANMAKTLLQKGETALLKGFTSKAGKKFDAKLKIEGADVKFEFPPREPPPG